MKRLKSFFRESPLALPANHRLAFREVGLAIGLRSAVKLKRVMTETPGCFKNTGAARPLEEIIKFSGLAPTIEDLWLTPENQKTFTWTEHRDINEVMLATSLAPEGYLSV